MKIVGLMPVRNEAWCLGFTARVALEWVDELVILLHEAVAGESADSEEITHQIYDEVGDRLYVDGMTGEWREMEHRQYMLEQARKRGATHIAIIDADEFLTANLMDDAKILGTKLWGRTMIVQLPGYNLRGGIDQYHSNGIWGKRWFSLVFKDDPRLHWAGDRFHHREPFGLTLQPYRPIRQGDGGVMHLWGASERRLRAKHRLYRITERIRWPGKPVQEIEQEYNLYRSPQDCALKYPQAPEWAKPWEFLDVPPSWIKPYFDRGWGSYLDLEAEPWQNAECERLIAQYGSDYFKGLTIDA